MCGPIRESMKVNGRTIKCMEKVYSLGQMVGNTKGTITMIKSRDMECSHGQTAENMKENGIMENNMERESITHLKERLKEENGEKERDSNGLKMNDKFYLLLS